MKSMEVGLPIPVGVDWLKLVYIYQLYYRTEIELAHHYNTNMLLKTCPEINYLL